jgi:Lrp/AsnC family transcriptional regulator, regulator for asnA, asnC and gidA
MEKLPEIDNIDREILTYLTKDAKMPYTEIAKKLIVSPGTIHVRIKKLESIGIIQGSTLTIDYARLGYDLMAFIGIFLAKGSIYNDVIVEMNAIPEVIEAHYTTGSYSIFAKIMCRNTKHLRDIINDRIQVINGIIRTETILSLEESIRKHVPLL